MCGIAGAFFGDKVEAASLKLVVQRMTDALAHRGPDGQGVTVARTQDASAWPAVVFGHRRLAIIDLSERGAQPMADAQGHRLLTFNGEIYNYRALRQELESRGRAFRSESDTEVILQAYAEWGDECLTRLRGMFAFGLWDDERRRLLLARDRFGIKPLYIAKTDGGLLFASEIRALLASNRVAKRLDPDALWHYLGYQTVPGPETLVEGVTLVNPGTCVIVDEGGRISERRYWDLLTAACREDQEESPAAAVRRVRELLDESIQLHLVADVPVGVFLSGGIDSSALVGLIRSAGRTPLTFSVGFQEAAFDESALASEVASRFSADHTHIELTEEALLADLPHALESMDHPSGDGVNSHVVSNAVRKAGVKVALSGLGADELFGGYPSFSRLERTRRPLETWGAAPQAIRGAAAGVVRAVGGSVASEKLAAVLESDGSLAAAWPVTRQLLSVEQRRTLLTDRWAAAARHPDPYVARLSSAYDAAPRAGLWAKVSYAEARTYMHDVLLRDTDQMSMAHGLEVRVPFLDHRLAEYVVGLPDSCKRLDDGPKPLLVRAMDSLLPREIVLRPKQGFTLPFDPWMRSALRELCEGHLGPQGLEGRQIFKPGAVTKLWRDFLDHDRRTSWARLWSLVALNAWLARHDIEAVP